MSVMLCVLCVLCGIDQIQQSRMGHVTPDPGWFAKAAFLVWSQLVDLVVTWVLTSPTINSLSPLRS